MVWNFVRWYDDENFFEVFVKVTLITRLNFGNPPISKPHDLRVRQLFQGIHFESLENGKREIGGVVSRIDSGWRVCFDLQVEESSEGLVVKDVDGRVCSQYKIHRIHNRDGDGILFLKMDHHGRWQIPENEKLLQKGSDKNRYFVIQRK